MLASVIRQLFRRDSALNEELFRRASALDEQLGEWTPQPFHDELAMAPHVRLKSQKLRDAGYLHYPALVHIETQAVCNAACTFCPYPNLERKGTRMSDALIEKILNDLTAIPRDLPFQLAPYKVSDPFIEARLFDILRAANERLPNARISLITNGAALTDTNIRRLQGVRGVSYVNVSLNYCDPREYEAVMKIPFERTVRRLDALHESRPQHPVYLTRVSVDRDSDLAFMRWVKERYPLFQPAIGQRNDWIGEVPGAQATMVPDAPCHRWFDLSITATGIVAMCCMDGQARYPKGDVRREHALDIYNRPHLLDLRKRLISRREAADPCRQCTYLSF